MKEKESERTREEKKKEDGRDADLIFTFLLRLPSALPNAQVSIFSRGKVIDLEKGERGWKNEV